MTQAVIYHNPRCSKSRDALAILKAHGMEIEEVRYLDNPPSKETLSTLCSLMGVEPLQIVRTGEELFKALELSVSDHRTAEEWLEILIKNPRLIERPIVKIGHQAIMGRPPENILKILP